MKRRISMAKIIQKIHKLIKNPFRILSRKGEISKSKAIKIQQDAYHDRTACKRDDFDAPYTDIIKFLDSPHDEIFMSAVLNLSNIAKQGSKNKGTIKKILQNKLASGNLTESKKNYLAEHISKI